MKLPRIPSSMKKVKSKKSSSLTRYESRELREIKEWKAKEPSVIDKTLGIVVEPLSWMVRKIVPDAALLGALNLARLTASMTVDKEDILRDGGVEEIEHLRRKNLKLSDRLADEVHNWAIGIATVEGAGTGFFGIFGAPVDIPALVTISLRTIEKIGLCYGYEVNTKREEDFVMGVLSTAGANSMEEKLGALLAIRSIQQALVKQTWKKMAETAAKTQMSKEGAIIALRNLAKQLSINITKRKALAAIPWIGSLIGGSMNAWYLRDVGWAARRVYQERWLKENGKPVS
jgi:hypothetical protein